MKQNLLISFSGGRTSAFMTQWLLNNMQHKYNMEVVFSNTGKERPETLDFVEKCDEHFEFNLTWVEAVVNPSGEGTGYKRVSRKTAAKNGEPFEAVIAKYGIPNKMFPHCNRELKLAPIHSYVKCVLGWRDYTTAIGIRADEPKRIKWEKVKSGEAIYPLATMIRTTKSDINLFWSKQPFDLELKSYEGNCDMCWKKSQRKLLTLLIEKPELAEWWNKMEIKYGAYTPPSRSEVNPPYTFYRDNNSIQDLIELSRFPFIVARDESNDIDKFKQMLLFDIDMDEEEDCTESCEAA